MIITIKKPINFLEHKVESVLSNLPNDTFLVVHKYCQRCNFAQPMVPQGVISAPVLFVGKTFNVSMSHDKIFHATLSTLGISKSDVLYVGALGCYLTKDLTDEEMCVAVERCFVWKQELLKRMTNLQLIILAGMQAFNLFYGYVERFSDYLGYVFESEVSGRVVKVIPIPSPVYLSRNSEARRKTKKVLEELRGLVCLVR